MTGDAMSRHNPKLLAAVAKKTGRTVKSVREAVSRRASRAGVLAQVALVGWAQELGLGVVRYQKRLPFDQLALVSGQSKARPNTLRASTAPSGQQEMAWAASPRTIFTHVVETVLTDTELSKRCADMLRNRPPFDRVVNQATQVLEGRIKMRIAPDGKRLVGVKLVRAAMNADLDETRLKFSDEPEIQQGLVDIIRGVVLAFRNPSHHDLSDDLSREDAMRICGLIDVLLRQVDSANLVR